MINVFASKSPEFKELLKKKRHDDHDCMGMVQDLMNRIKNEGDQAVLEYTSRFDQVDFVPSELKVTAEEIEEAYGLVEEKFLVALRKAIDNVTAFHKKQLTTSWMEPDETGSILGQLNRPIERVGIYVPGGTAPLPSSVLMNALPAKVAGVKEIVMVTPPGKNKKVNPYIVVAANECGVTEMYRVGGAQSIGALAYGTDTIQKVDKITGPGNIYVTMAKKLAYGAVDIDMLAGPSEILIIADEKADPEYLAADLLSQAEHDVLASSVLVTPDKNLADKVKKELAKQLAVLERVEIATESLANYSAIIIATDMMDAIDVANEFAPEHLEMMVEAPFEILGKIKNAGAIFMGKNTPEPVGDYWAGPNHILPTGGTAKFYSPVNVDTFMKKSSIIYFSDEKLQADGEYVIELAEKEGLGAHANAVRVRMRK